MKNLTTVVIETARLKLVPQSVEYAPVIFKEFTSDITQFMMPKSPERLEETIAYLESVKPSLEHGTDLPLVILNKTTGEFIGGAGAHKLQTATPILGIWIKKAAHGNKYGHEAVTGIKKWIDDNVSYEYIIYPVDKRNVASRKIAESLGGLIKAEYKKINMAGAILDEVEYRIYPTA